MKSNNPSSPASVSTPDGSLQTAQTEGVRSVKEMAGDAKRSASNMIDQAKERASTMAQEQKQSAAQRIGRCGSALRDSARSVEQEDPNIAYFANSAAERIERVADYLRSTDLDGLRHDAEDLARRRPALFMGGMLVAGLIVGSIIKASASAARDEGENISSASDEAQGDIEPLDSPDVLASQTGSSL